ncbi:MAG: nucleotidyltransferase domain-containing protein [Nanoarchaeota archaeon]|nr:nucleotidyltransferase domain-containing protein [Nanoarchaeota archaeon]
MLHKCSIWAVAGAFFQEPTKEHGLLELCRITKIAHTSVKIHLVTLKKEGIISRRIEKKGSREYPVYKAKQEDRIFRDYKKVYNFEEVISSGLTVFLKDSLMPRTIVLFGSYQKGEDIEGSDIDIFVEAEKAELDISRFEKRLKRKVQLHFKADFKKYPAELKNSIVNGNVLEGYLEAF